MAIDGTARTLTKETDWRAAYDNDALGALQAATSAQNALYERMHIIRRGSLEQLAGNDWLDEIAARESYAWFAGKKGDRSRVSEDRVARALAWLDHACTCRHRVLHHRATGVPQRFVVLPSAICEVYWTTAPRLAAVVEQLRAARLTYGLPGDVPDSPESVAYLGAIAEKLHLVEPSASDVMNRAIRSSGVYVLVGSAPLVDNLDHAVASLLEERFSQPVG